MKNRTIPIFGILFIITIVLLAINAYAETIDTAANSLQAGDKIMFGGQERIIKTVGPGIGANEIKITFESGEQRTVSKTAIFPKVVTAPPAPTPTPTPVQPAAGTTPAPTPTPTPAPQTTNKPADELKSGDKIMYEGREQEVAAVDYSPITNSYEIKFKSGKKATEFAGTQFPIVTPAQKPATDSSTERYATEPPIYTSRLIDQQPVRPMDMNPDIYKLEKKRQALEEWKRKRANEAAPTGEPFKPGIFVAQFLSSYDRYRGLAKLGSLFFTGDNWEEYRSQINQVFCDTILLGGTKCITSRICDTQLYAIMPRNVFTGRTPSGERLAVAEIQGEKSLPIAAVDEQGNPYDMRLYKTTFAITNPNPQITITYNIQFRTDNGDIFNWHPEMQALSPGSTGYATEQNPILEYGKRDYTKVCLVFNPGIVDYNANWHGKTVKEWCSPIIQYIGTATKPYPTATDSPSTTPPDDPTLPPVIPAGPNRREGF